MKENEKGLYPYQILDINDLEGEQWRDIEGYSNYMISNCGRVKSLDYNRTGKPKIRKQKFDKDGYLTVNLWKNGKQKTFKVHRLVALAFLDNPSKFPEVNHKDEIKTNNCIENLEWCTTKYNINYGTAISRRTEKLKGRIFSKEHKQHISESKKGKKQNLTEEQRQKLIARLTGVKKSKATMYKISNRTLQMTEDNQIIKVWESGKEAGRQLHISSGNISKACNNKIGKDNSNLYKGYRWSYFSPPAIYK